MVRALLDDLFLASYTVDGGYLRSWVLASDYQEYIEGIAADDLGAIYVTGYFGEGGVDMGGGPCGYAGRSDILVASYSAESLTHRWSRCFGGSESEFSRDIALDDSRNVYITGKFDGELDFEGETLVSEGAGDIFVASLSTDGDLRWARRFGGIDFDGAQGITIEDDGRIIVTGHFKDTVDFGGTVLTSRGEQDVFVAALTPDGRVQRVESFGGVGPDYGQAVASDECGNMWVTGSMSDTVELGGDTLTSVGRSDVFLLKLCAP
jgi:hypothetical protein